MTAAAVHVHTTLALVYESPEAEDVFVNLARVYNLTPSVIRAASVPLDFIDGESGAQAIGKIRTKLARQARAGIPGPAATDTSDLLRTLLVASEEHPEATWRVGGAAR